MLKVAKFGGSSMADAKQFEKVRDIVRADPARKVIVVSAAGKRSADDHKLTDLLYLCYAHLQYGVSCDAIFQMIADRYIAIRDECGLNVDIEAELGFVIGTGSALGERIGIRACPAIGFDLSRDSEPGCCRPEVFRTANGTAEGCVARVPSIRFGAFELRNPRVAVMPGMDGQALLGMDVLRHFSLVQEGGRLRISRAGR